MDFREGIEHMKYENDVLKNYILSEIDRLRIKIRELEALSKVCSLETNRWYEMIRDDAEE